MTINVKVCTGKCKKEKPLLEFNKNKSKKDGLNSICRDCSKNRSRQYYSDNKDVHYKKTYNAKQERIGKNQEYIKTLLHLKGCFDCGEKDPVVLEFDHLVDKKFNISKMLNSGYSLQSLKKEIAKCAIRCANCHRRKTAKDFNWYKAKGH